MGLQQAMNAAANQGLVLQTEDTRPTGNMYSTIALRFADNPDRVAVVDADDPGRRAYTWREIDAMSARYANLLQEKGIQKDTHVLVAVPKSIEGLALDFACKRLGAVLVPVEELEPGADAKAVARRKMQIDQINEDCRLAAAIVAPGMENIFKNELQSCSFISTLGTGGGGSLPREAAAQSEIFETAKLERDHRSTVVYTSGSTGKPKGVIHTDGMIQDNMLALGKHWEFNENTRVLNGIPLVHVHGLNVATYTPLAAGGSVVFMRKFGSAQAVKCLEEIEGINVFMGVPLMYKGILRNESINRERLTAAFEGVLCIGGSAYFAPDMLEAWQEKTGQDILIRYGATEMLITVAQIKGHSDKHSIGFMLEGAQFLLRDYDTGEPVEDGALGEVWIASRTVTPGYLNRSEVNAQTFRVVDGTRYYRTGDLMRLNPDNSFKYESRADFVINLDDGNRLSPNSITDPLMEDPSIESRAQKITAFGVEARDGSTRIAIAVVPEKGVGREERDALEAAILRHCETFPPYMRPQDIVYMNHDLPGVGPTEKPNVKGLMAGHGNFYQPKDADRLLLPGRVEIRRVVYERNGGEAVSASINPAQNVVLAESYERPAVPEPAV